MEYRAGGKLLDTELQLLFYLLGVFTKLHALSIFEKNQALEVTSEAILNWSFPMGKMISFMHFSANIFMKIQ